MAGDSIERGVAPPGLAGDPEGLTEAIDSRLHDFSEKEAEAMNREAELRLAAAEGNNVGNEDEEVDEGESVDVDSATDNTVPIATYFETEKIEVGLCKLPGDLRRALFFILFRIVARVVYEEDNLKLKSHRKYLSALKEDRQNILSPNQPDAPNMPTTVEEHSQLLENFPRVADLIYVTHQRRRNMPNSRVKAVNSEDELVKLLVHTVYPQAATSKVCSQLKNLCSRNLLHYITGLFKKLEAMEGQSGDGMQDDSVQAYSKGDFFPTLVVALLNRGTSKCSLSDIDRMDLLAPKGWLVPHKIASDWYRYFPANIEVELGNVAHPSIALSFTDSDATTSESGYTPLASDANKDFAGKDKFWESIKSTKESDAGHYLHNVLIAALVHSYKTENQGEGVAPSASVLLKYALSEEVRFNKINMQCFFEDEKRMQESFRTFFKKKTGQVVKQDYKWNVEANSDLGMRIARALNSDNLHEINSVARDGMTTDLFLRLKHIRTKYQEWRRSLATAGANKPGGFLACYNNVGRL